MKITKEQAKQALKPLIEDDLFVIQGVTIFYDTVVFGNSYILLRAQNGTGGMTVEFTDDRGDTTCNVGVQFRGRWYKLWLEDVCKYLNLSLPEKPSNFLDMVKVYSIAIRENKDKLFEAFDDNHREETYLSIQKILWGKDLPRNLI